MSDSENTKAAVLPSRSTAELADAIEAEKEMEKQKCAVSEDGKFISPCKTLAEATEFGNPIGKRKGIWCWEYHSRDKPGPARRFWGAKSGDFVSNGMAFNYCPFCGEKIEAPFTDH